VTEIEAHIAELGQVFGRLGELVADHQELTERLHENTVTTVENVEAAHSRLLRTMQQLSSGRALALKLGAVGLTFTVGFIVFLA
jgi:syntaxin 5